MYDEDNGIVYEINVYFTTTVSLRRFIYIIGSILILLFKHFKMLDIETSKVAR